MTEKLKKNSLLTALALLVCCMLLATVYYLPLIPIGYWRMHETLSPSTLVIVQALLLLLLSGLAGLLGWIFAQYFPKQGKLTLYLSFALLAAAAGYLVFPGEYTMAMFYIVDEIRPVDVAPVWRQLVAWVFVHPMALCSYGVGLGVYTLRNLKPKDKPKKRGV